VLAAEDKGFHTPGGLYKPDVQMFNWGRVYFLQHFGQMIDEVIDLCGRSAVIFPTEAQWNDPEMRPWLERLNTGAAGTPYDRIKIARVIRDLYLTDWGGRLFMFENFNGTPLQTLLSLTMKRAEFTGAGPLAAFARNVCGLGTADDRATEYKTTADYAKAQDAGRPAIAPVAAE
jgi:4-hydroxyphenylacetate 3-monooxygenase/chlorophenol-4-monooxygenase component 2